MNHSSIHSYTHRVIYGGQGNRTFTMIENFIAKEENETGIVAEQERERERKREGNM